MIEAISASPSFAAVVVSGTSFRKWPTQSESFRDHVQPRFRISCISGPSFVKGTRAKLTAVKTVVVTDSLEPSLDMGSVYDRRGGRCLRAVFARS